MLAQYVRGLVHLADASYQHGLACWISVAGKARRLANDTPIRQRFVHPGTEASPRRLHSSPEVCARGRDGRVVVVAVARHGRHLDRRLAGGLAIPSPPELGLLDF